jgi:hypothetical protein
MGMASLMSSKIKEYYDRFRSIDVIFSKEIIAVTGLDTRQVHVKCVSDFFPCIIYSSSFEGAKIIVNIKSGIVEKLRTANNTLSLRFCFKHRDSAEPLTFFVQARNMGLSSYGASEEMAMLTLQYSQHPSDDLIEIMGRLLDATVNSSKRREERVLLTSDIMRKLCLTTKDAAAFLQGVPRRCIIRDISFSGAKIVMVGVVKFLIDRDAGLRVDFDDPRESFMLKGKFIRAELVEGRKDLVVLGMQFIDPIPMGYKLRLSDYLNTVKVTVNENFEKTNAPNAPKAIIADSAGTIASSSSPSG